MVSINYNRLFNLRVSHDYFEDGKLRGMKLAPTRETGRILRGGQMLFKTIPTGFTILYKAEADEISPIVELSAELTLTFTMAVENKAEFLNITNLDESPTESYRSGNILYFTNNPGAVSINAESPESISHVLIDGTQNSLFTYHFTVSGSPNQVRLIVSDEDGNVVSAGTEVDGTPLPSELEVAKNDDDSYSRQIDLRNKPTGLYTITILHITDDTTQYKEETFYVSDELASQNVLGIVDIIYESTTGHLYADTEQYELQFSRKETIWKYFVVNKNQHVTLASEDLFIEDLGLPSAHYSPITFTREGDEPHATVSINGMETVIFRSDTPIPFFEIPKASVQLKKNPGDTILVSNMPNPAHNGVVKEQSGALESEIYVFI
ncbi:hypothetical protein NC796_05690 [Aliifodinibius sp. S!AR15-10]|uniref:hypothetical protein n=1 Tax=Aliifodinibius sp. S!AR15-10 TaxID=2950437 RepID=UPI00285B17D2|nr:hypothetical protein [Aliifodinibius sp. S!AR15-10]MDR8390621.1 hypothetical protein [Aliifodinibius sp. S!AR15-10]